MRHTLSLCLCSSALMVLFFVPDEAWSQDLRIQISSPTLNSCVPNNPELQPGGSPDEPGTFIPSSVPLSFTVTEPNGDDVTLSATVNGNPVSLTNSTVFTDGPNVETLVEFYAIEGDQVNDGTNLVLVLTAQSPAGTATDTVTFDLDRLPPSIEFSADDIAIYGSCNANPVSVMNGIIPIVSDQYDPSPVLSVSDQSESCTLTRIFTVSDHCGEGNSQEVYFQVNIPSIDPADFYVSGAEDGEFYLETFSYFGVTDSNCFITTGLLTVDDAPPIEVITGTFLDTPGSYTLDLTAEDCAGTVYSERTQFSLLEKPYAATDGPYQSEQGQAITLDGGESFCPPELGGIIEYAWDFNLLDDNDGGYRHLGDIVDFNDDGEPFDDGVYTVGLRITTQAGQVEYDNTEVVITDAPPVCDPGGPYEIEQGLFLTFDGSDSTFGTPSEPILAYRWHFGEFPGDLNEQFAPNLTQPEHFYIDEGEYTVTLTAYDIDSSCTAETLVTVVDVEPIVRDLRVIGEGPFIEGNLLTFSAGTTSAGSAAEPIIQFIWSWDDGTADTTSLLGEELRRPTHRFLDSGRFNVCLSVDDGDSLITGCMLVDIIDIQPIARLSGDLFAIEGEPANFSIAGTRPGGEADPLSHALINWGDGSEIQRIEDFDVTDLTHTFQTNGTLMITMTLYDEDLDSPMITQLEIYVDDVSPTPNISAPFIRQDGVEVPIFVEEGLEALWSAADSTPGAPSDPIISYRWDWGDGSPVEEGADIERAHTYADDGSYLLRLTAIDSDQSLSTLTSFVDVRNRAPFNAEITTQSSTVDFGEPVRFEVTYEDVPNDFVSISWRMGEGSTYVSQRIVNHTYRELGIFTVRATLTDEDGGETVVSYDIEVTPAGPRILIPLINSIAEGERLSFEVELRAAESNNGGLDGPVELRILKAPQGMTATQLESPNPTLSNRFRFTWQTHSGSAGLHQLKLMGVSPSGIIRLYEQELEVLEAQERILATLGGSINQASLSLFRYASDIRRETTELERFAFINLGRGIGHFLLVRNDYFVTVPHSGVVAVVGESEGRLLRRVPVGGEPYAIAHALDYIWTFDARRPQVVAIDRRLKVYRQALIDGLEGRVIAAQGIQTTAGDRIVALSSYGELLILDPEAFVSNQPSRAVLNKIYLTQRHTSSTESQAHHKLPIMGGLFVHDGTDLIVNTSREIYSFDLSKLNDEDLSPKWTIRSVSSLRAVTVHQGKLWSVSEQGLRRFEWPQDGFGLAMDAPDISGTVLDLNQQSTLVSFPEPLLGESILITANHRQITHLSSESLRQVLNTPDLNPQRLMVITRNTED
jgi:PKD repeat protein